MSLKSKSAAGCAFAVIAGLFFTLPDSDNLVATPESINELITHEGCSSEAYKCPGGKLTDGVGNTVNVIPDQPVSNEKIAHDLVRNVAAAEHCVYTYFRGHEMPEPAFHAMTSLVFNIGCYGVRYNAKYQRPTKIAQFANAAEWDRMCYQMLDFVNIRGSPSQGLIKRRKSEIQQCLQYKK